MKPKPTPSVSRFGLERSRDKADKNPHPNGWGFAAAQSSATRRAALARGTVEDRSPQSVTGKSLKRTVNGHTFIFMVVETNPVFVYNADIPSRPGDCTFKRNKTDGILQLKEVHDMRILSLGSLNIDHIYAVPHFIQGAETLTVQGLTQSVGGKGLNQSVAAARAGAPVFHAGMLGRGGGPLQAFLNQNNVDTSLIRPCEIQQGHTVIQVDPSGQNCILVYGGSNQQIEKSYIDEVLSHFVPGDCVMLQNEISNLHYAVEAAHAKGLHIVLNASPFHDALFSLDFKKLDWLVVNELECAAIGACSDTWRAYQALRNRFPSLGILLTLGAEGSLCWKDGQQLRQKAFPTQAIDTTGAGDTFVGYFVGCLAQGFCRADSMRLASMAAAIAVSRPGAAPSIPQMGEVRQAFQQTFSK